MITSKALNNRPIWVSPFCLVYICTARTPYWPRLRRPGRIYIWSSGGKHVIHGTRQ